MNKTRFAPSPTGNLHIGGARTAIISWLVAKKLKGNFILRIEDTDIERSKQEYVDSITDSLKWLDLKFDEGPFYQTNRYARYKEVAESLVKEGLAYYCYSSQEVLNKKRQDYKILNGHDGWKYDREWRDSKEIPPNNIVPSIRLKIPLEGNTSWKDLTKSLITIPNSQLDDFIILRSDGSPTYNFCVVVDDSDMGVTHVIRGDDHINNTPKQIHIYKAINKDIPIFGHIPLILNIDGTKQSKRENIKEDEKIDDGKLKPMTNLNYYRDNGVLPEAIINYLLLISCNDNKKEIFTKEEYINMFELNKLGNTPIKFDLDKLIWLNQQHIKLLNNEKFLEILDKEMKKNNFEYNDNIDNLLIFKASISERSKLTKDFYPLIEPLLKWNKNGIRNNNLIEDAINKIISLENFNPKSINDELVSFCKERGIKFGELMNPLRVEVFNNLKIPLNEALFFIGKDELKDTTKKKIKP